MQTLKERNNIISSPPVLKRFQEPTAIEYREHFRPGMGTENVGPFLRSMVQMTRPNRGCWRLALAILLHSSGGSSQQFSFFDDGCLNEDYFDNYKYDPRLVIIDDMSLGDLLKKGAL